MKCPICANKVKTSKGLVPGYVAGTSYPVFKCQDCETQFISSKYDKKIYELIYSSKGDFGYERYSRYVSEIKKQEDPLLWLSIKEPAYLYVQQYLKQDKLKILEVGCGDGYLTYAMNQAGHQATGIDISTQAVSMAKANFGDFYQAVDIKDFKSLYAFDLIVCTETIEHLENPLKFINECKRLLMKKGAILLTTPNKDYRSPNTTWQTEAPPVHRFWFGHKSFLKLAERTDLECEFLPLVMPMDMERNNIVAYFSSRGSNTFGPVLDKKGKVLPSRPSLLRNMARSISMWGPIRYISNGVPLYAEGFIPSRWFHSEPPTLGVVLK